MLKKRISLLKNIKNKLLKKIIYPEVAIATVRVFPRPWGTLEWKAIKDDYLDDSCKQCSGKEILTLQHTVQPDRPFKKLSDYVKDNLPDPLRDGHWAIVEKARSFTSPRQLTRSQKRKIIKLSERESCPRCESIQLKKTEECWKCKKCKTTFDKQKIDLRTVKGVERESCPSCKSVQVKIYKKESWKCRGCKAVLDKPIAPKPLSLPPMSEIDLDYDFMIDGHYFRQLGDLYETELSRLKQRLTQMAPFTENYSRYDLSELMLLFNRLREECFNAAVTFIDQSIEYATLDNTETFCKKCAYMWDKQKKTICKKCNEQYHHFDKKQCRVCSGEMLLCTKCKKNLHSRSYEQCYSCNQEVGHIRKTFGEFMCEQDEGIYEHSPFDEV